VSNVRKDKIEVEEGKNSEGSHCLDVFFLRLCDVCVGGGMVEKEREKKKKEP
jgi:hypothetical protein